jgi:hypothetical protein
MLSRTMPAEVTMFLSIVCLRVVEATVLDSEIALFARLLSSSNSN